MIPTIIGITLISFFIIHLAPGKPTDILSELNPKITPEAMEKLEKYWKNETMKKSEMMSGQTMTIN